jgi:hypothetical protein
MIEVKATVYLYTKNDREADALWNLLRVAAEEANARVHIIETFRTYLED